MPTPDEEDPRVVARLRYPMRVDGIDRLMRSLSKVYADRGLVIVTDGALYRDGWMTIAHPD